MITLQPHQIEGLRKTEGFQCCAFYWDMGTGKTFGGSEKMKRYGNSINLIVCQKSKIDDWVNHIDEHYSDDYDVFDLTKKIHYECFIKCAKEKDVGEGYKIVGIINYELCFRRPELKKLRNFTLMLDESSMIQNEQAKRTKFILSMRPKNVILLSGTPTGGKYEKLYSQLKLLGWSISKKLYWQQYIETVDMHVPGMPFPIKKVVGYKNEERLKQKFREHGAVFIKTEDVLDLPEQVEQTIKVLTSADYRRFRKNCIVKIHTKSGEPIELVGDTTLTKMLYERQLCGAYSTEKLEAFRDILESTSERLIVFYNFTVEFVALCSIAIDMGKPISIVNGDAKDLSAYENKLDSVTFIQYQAGAMGLNLQKCCRTIYFTPPVSCELFMQSKKRTHRIGQDRTCFYYYLTAKGSIEEKIYAALEKGVDYTERLFDKRDID